MRKLINTVLAGAFGLSMIAGVSAQEFDTEDAAIIVGLNTEAGGVTVVVEQAPNFGEVDYSVQEQTYTSESPLGDLRIRVTYDVGDASGWNLTIHGEDFSSDDETDADTFSVDNLQLGEGGVSKPADVPNAPGVVGNVDSESGAGLVMSGEPQNLVSASADLGSNGVFIVTYTGNSLTIPAGTPVNTYTSTITVTSATGP